MLLIYSTFPDEESAVRVAKGALERHLVGCVNIFRIHRSMYWWEGKIAEDQEWGVIFKTMEERADELQQYIKENHPYTTPAIIRVKAEGVNPDYLSWLEGCIRTS